MTACFLRSYKTVFSLFFIALTVFGLPQQVWAKAVHHHHAVHHYALVDKSAAYADIIINAQTGEILHSTNPDSLRHPASLTKMMTLYLTFQALDSGKLTLNQYLPVSANAAEQPPSKIGVRPGQKIRVEDAILSLVTESANDVAVVLGEWMGGNEVDFGRMMTRQAHALGMTHTNFDNPSGLPDPDQVTTAHDMAILGHALIYHFPQFYSYFSHDHFVYAGISHHNHNHLMDRYDGMDGIKTGYIRASGFNLVASAKRGNIRLIGVVFGGHSAVARDNRMAELLDDAFDHYRAPKANDKDKDNDNDKDADADVAANKTDATPITFAQGDSDDSDADSSNYTPLPSKQASPTAQTRANIAKQTASSQMATTKQQDAVKNTEPASDNNWGVQIGAYSDASIGRQAVASLVNSMPQLLGSGEPQVQKVAISGTTMYRARLMSLDQKTAQGVCAYLVQHGQGCLTVGP